MGTPSETTDYDPRYDRAQTIEGAKARYVSEDGYGEEQLEADLERLLTESEHPDGREQPIQDEPILDGQTVHI